MHRDYLKVCNDESKPQMSMTVFIQNDESKPQMSMTVFIQNDESKPQMSMAVFVQRLKAQNVSIFEPRKDQCCQFQKWNTTEEIYQSHGARKNAAQAEKANDNKLPASSRTSLVRMEIQRVFLSPSLKASALYYKTKLKVHNYTVFDLATRASACYLWNEPAGTG